MLPFLVKWKSRKKRKMPKWLSVIWGGFNVGMLFGVMDAFLVITYGLVDYNRFGPIMGLIMIDALGYGIIGSLVFACVYFFIFPKKVKIQKLRSYSVFLSLFIITIVLFLISHGSIFSASLTNVESGDPNIVFVTLDTLRSDSVGFDGHPFVRTPALDRMAQRGIVFSNAICPVPMTTPSHASLLTSTIPAVHGALENRYRLGDENESIAEILQNHGYQTAAFLSCFPLDRRFGLDQGFSIYHDQLGIPGDLRQASWLKILMRFGTRNVWEHKASYTNSLVKPWLRKYASKGNFFLWIHYFDPHAPYLPPDHEKMYYENTVTNSLQYTDENDRERARRAIGINNQDVPKPGRPEELYLGEVSYMDHAIEEVICLFHKENLFENTIFAVMADHGESFGEHGLFYTHGEDIYEPGLRIPLLICGGNIKSRMVDNQLASILDVAPTVLSLLGFNPGKEMDGCDLLDDSVSRQVALIENFGIIMAKNTIKQRGMRTLSHKLISFGPYKRNEFFNLSSDPKETNDLSSNQPEIVESFIGLTRNGFNKADSARVESEADQSEQTMRKLEALGYIL